MPPDVKLQGLFPGFQPLKRVLLQGGGKCCVVNKGFSRKSLHLPPAVSSPSFLAPNHHQHWIQLEKLGMVGTFTQISLLFFFLSTPCHVVVLVAVVIDLCLMSSCYWLRFF